MYDVSQNIRRVGFYQFKTRKLEAGTRAAIVNDLRTADSQEANTFYVLTDNILEKTLLKFTFDKEIGQWKEPTPTVACMTESRVTNSFLLDNEVLIICTLQETIVIDCRSRGEKPKPRQYKTPKIKHHIPQGKKLASKLHEFNEAICNRHQDTLGHEYGKDGLSYSCEISYQTKSKRPSQEPVLIRVFNCADSLPAHNLSEKQLRLGENEQRSAWICRFSYVDIYRSLVPINPSQESLKLEGIDVCSLLEFGQDQMAISTTCGKILIFKNWTITKTYQEKYLQDISFGYGRLSPIAGFHPETFPFIVCSGSNGLHIFNTANDYMDPLFQSKMLAQYSQQAFFSKTEEYGISMHISITEQKDDSVQHIKWVQMKFSPDFKRVLQKIGGLPIYRISQMQAQRQRLHEKDLMIAAKDKELQEAKEMLKRRDIERVQLLDQINQVTAPDVPEQMMVSLNYHEKQYNMIMSKLSQANSPEKAFSVRNKILEIDHRFKSNTNALKGAIGDDEDSSEIEKVDRPQSPMDYQANHQEGDDAVRIEEPDFVIPPHIQEQCRAIQHNETLREIQQSRLILQRVEEGNKYNSFVNINSMPSNQQLQRSGGLFDSRTQFERHIASHKRAAIETLSNTINNFSFDAAKVTLEGWNTNPYAKVSLAPSLRDTTESFHTLTSSKQISNRSRGPLKSPIQSKPTLAKAKKYKFIHRRSISQQNVLDLEPYRVIPNHQHSNVSPNLILSHRANKKQRSKERKLNRSRDFDNVIRQSLDAIKKIQRGRSNWQNTEIN